jgi:superfamily II DNA helicase RecQ
VNLFVIDEAHNLRKEDGTRYQYITDWIRENQPCPVLLVTATPINNQLMDFAAQINMATAGDSRAFIIQIPKTSGKQYENLDYYDAINNLDSQIKRDRTA